MSSSMGGSTGSKKGSSPGSSSTPSASSPTSSSKSGSSRLDEESRSGSSPFDDTSGTEWTSDRSSEHQEGDVAMAIPCPGRREAGNWVLDTVPLMAPKAADAAQPREIRA